MKYQQSIADSKVLLFSLDEAYKHQTYLQESQLGVNAGVKARLVTTKLKQSGVEEKTIKDLETASDLREILEATIV